MRTRKKSNHDETTIISVRAKLDVVNKFTVICNLKGITAREQFEKMLIDFIKKESASAYENATQILRVGS